jgi:outer membrane protein TolC
MATKKQVLFYLFICSFLGSKAQSETKSLQLTDAVKLAVNQNRQISLAKKDEKIAQAQFKQTESIWLPQLNLSYTGFLTNQPLSAFGFKLQQAQVQQDDFNPAVLNHPDATGNAMAQLSLQQPIINQDLTYMRKAALKQSEVYAYQVKRTKDAVEMQVTNTYLQLEFSYEVVNLLKEVLKTVEEIHRFTNDRYNQGLLQKSDLLNVDVQVKVAETNLAEAQSQIRNISDQLSLLMNAPAGIVYQTVPVLINISEVNSFNVSTDRADVKALSTAVSAYDLAIKSTKMSMLPKLNGFANYQLNDKSLVGFGANGYMAGLQLSWDIFKGNQAKNKIAVQQLEKNKLQEQLQDQIAKGSVEIRKTISDLRDAAYKIDQQKKAVEQAEESLRIMQNRYSQGLVNTTDLLMAQTQWAHQKMLKAQAVFIQKSTATYLQFLTTNN